MAASPAFALRRHARPTRDASAPPPMTPGRGIPLRRALAQGRRHGESASTRSNTPPRTVTRSRSGSSAACMPKATASRRTICAPSSISAASPTATPTTIPDTAAGALRRQRLRRARPLLSRRHSEDRRSSADPAARARDVRLCGVLFRRSRRAILSGAALSQRHRRARRIRARPRAGSASRRRRASARRRRCSAPCCSRATTCRARPRAA